MGFFDKIKENIFGRHEAPKAAPVQTAAIQSSVAAGIEAAANSVRSASANNAAPKPAAPQMAEATPTGTPASSASAPATAQSVDVTSILDKAVAAKGQKLEWRHSIVDLLKAIDADSSLTARKELAAELNYTGNTDDTATMNVWLHKAVIKKLAENGGKVPADLLD